MVSGSENVWLEQTMFAETENIPIAILLKILATAEIDINDAAQIGRTYQFTVVAVSNILASKNDMNYMNMLIGTLPLPYINQKPDGTISTENTLNHSRNLYDGSGERIEPGYAEKHHNEAGGVDPSGAILGVLIVC